MSEGFLAFIVVLIVGLMFLATQHIHSDCEKKGGVVIQGAIGLQCVKLEVVK